MPLEHLDEVTKNEDFPYAEWMRERDLYAWERERKTLLEDGREEGMAEGMVKGMTKGKTEGIAEGMAKGKAEGKEQNQKEIALRMLETGYAPSEISKLTSLSEQEIARLNGHLSARS